MTITKNNNGSITVSDIVNGYRVHKTYYGYTKKHAVIDFVSFCKQKR